MSATNGEFWTQQFLKDDGTPWAGVRVFHYVAGNTTTNLDVYQNGDLTAPHNNPVVGDLSGRVFFYGNGTYRLQVRSATADGNLILYDWDPVELVHHTATVRAEDKALSLPAATSAARGRLFGVTDASGDLLTLWLQRTASAWQQILTLPTLNQMIQFAKGTDIASTTSVTIPTNGNFFDITGTNAIESFTGFAGYPVIYTRTLAALTFVHSAQLVMKAARNRTTVANQVTGWLHVGAGVWVELFFTTRLFTDGALQFGEGELALPTTSRVLAHSGVVGTNPFWATGLSYHGPSSMGAGSTMAQAGTVTISANQNLSGIVCYSAFTLNAGVTLTLPVNTHRLVIIASDSITINGTITATGASVTGGAGTTGTGGVGQDGMTQPGAGGGGGQTGSGGVGGGVMVSGTVVQAGGVGGSGGGSGAAGVSQTGSLLHLSDVWSMMGGAGGGAGGGNNPSVGGAGGRGGGSIVLVAPQVTLASGAALTTNGNAGTGAGANLGGGGGGGAGNILIVTRLYTDQGAIFTMNGGASGNGGLGNGGIGAGGAKQVMIYG